MENGAEFTGRTVDDAVARAEAELGSRQDLTIEVLSQGSRGVFGIGAEPARIRVRRTPAPVPQAPAPTTPPRPAEREPSLTFEPAAEVAAPEEERIEPVEEEMPDGQPSPGPIPQPAEPARATANLQDEAQQVLAELLRAMGFQAEVTVQNLESPLTLGVRGENLGVLIGRRGDNLAALQFMVNLILSKNRRQWPRVVLDVENYRARREESLRSLAERIAYRVRRNGRPFTLEAMPASDRRVIHLALRDRDDVETYSIGEGPARRVVVAPKRASRTG